MAGIIFLLYFLSFTNRADETVPENSTASPTVPLATSSEVSMKSPEKDMKTMKLPKKLLSPWKSTMTTLFWVGERADADNAFITNTESYWDEKWEAHYGGNDDPNCRTGYLPCAFKPKENPFYFALPYAEYDPQGALKASAKALPWYGKDELPLLKNRWIAVKHGNAVCYAQWEDVGPNGEDDFAYVFKGGVPVNTFGEHAGLDISPALWKCLQMSDNGVTDWAFVDGAVVPPGPWKDTVTTSGISWGS